MSEINSFSKRVKIFLSEKTFQESGLNLKGKEKINEENIKAFFSVLPLFFYGNDEGIVYLDIDNKAFLEICAYSFIKYLDSDAEVMEQNEKIILKIKLNQRIKDYFGSDLSFESNEYSDKLFVRTLFILCGTVLDPQKGYHLSFKYRDASVLQKLSDILSKYDIEGKIIKSGNSHLYYIKGSESIEDILSFMGAEKFSLELIETKIEKSIRNDVNRKHNFDGANIKKSVDNAQRIIENIKYLDEIGVLGNLPESLLYAAEIRMKNPESSLRELCEISDQPITKSGLNHRFAKICEIASEYRRKLK